MQPRRFFLVSPLAAFLLACPGTTVPADSGTDAASDGALPETGSDASTSGRTLLFDSERALDGSDTLSAASQRNIWMIKDDGTGAKPLTHFAVAEAWAPVWSPDATHIAYTSIGAFDGSDALNGPLNIWVMNADGTGAKPLTRLTAAHADSYNLVWSPDGTKIAYQSQRALDGSDAENGNGYGVVWIMNADGTAAKPLTSFTNVQTEPWAFTPDGSQIVYRSTGTLDGMDTASGSNNVWIMKADGTAQTHLTAYTVKVFVDRGSFSVDGTTVLFQSDAHLDGSDAVYTNGAINLWTVGVTSMTKTALTNLTLADAHDAAYSPDGKTIVFGSDGALDGSDGLGVENVWRMNADGSARAPLTKLTKSFDYPAPRWSKDGTLLVFASQRALDGSDGVSPSGTTNGWLMKADGSGANPVTKLTATDCTDFALDH